MSNPEGPWAKVDGGPTYGALWVWDGSAYRALILGGAVQALREQADLLNRCFDARAEVKE